MVTALSIGGVLYGVNGLNYVVLLQILTQTAYAVNFTNSVTNLYTALLTDNLENILLSVANGAVSVIGLAGICESHMAMQILTKALAMYGATKNGNAFLKAVREDNIEEMWIYGLAFAMDIITIFSTCFDGDTPVATETGFKRIDEIQVGDKVWSYNVEIGEKSLKEVKQVFVKESNEILHIETTEGEIDATTNHPFYVIGKGWVVAGDLVVDDEVHTLDGDTDTVTGLKFEKTNESIPVYNIEIEDFQSYFVGNGVLVHNASCKPQSNSKPIWDPNSDKKIIDILQGKAQISDLLHTPNSHGVSMSDLLQKSPKQIEAMLKNGEISKRAYKAIKKAFESRNLHRE
jgi:hypothetical protein